MTAPANGARRPRVLLVTRNFPPIVGGMERYNREVLAQLGVEFDTALCGPGGCERFVGSEVEVRSSPVRPLPFFLVRTMLSALSLGAKFRPDVVLAGSGLTAPIALAVARRLGVPSGVFVYGLDIVVKNWLYQRAWLPAIRACDGAISISRYTTELAVAAGIAREKLSMVHPGTTVPPLDPEAGARFRAKHALGDRPMLISVGRLVPRKGLVEFVERCLPAIVAAAPGTVLVVIGGEPRDSLHGGAGGLGDQARATAVRRGIERNLLLLGQVPNDELAGALNAADVHVFPVIDMPGDVEGFGIVSLEAAAHGVPTAAFAVGGVPDAIDPTRSGTLVAPGDYAALADAVLDWIGRRGGRSEAIEFARSFEWSRIGEGLRDVVRNLAAAKR